MIILTIRTDKPEAELRLYDDQKMIAEIVWQAHRELSETIHLKIRDLIKSQNLELSDIGGVVGFLGPGSFTGLRIGLAAANTLAQQLRVPIVGGQGEKWQEDSVKKLLSGEDAKIILPKYGSDPHITVQKR